MSYTPTEAVNGQDYSDNDIFIDKKVHSDILKLGYKVETAKLETNLVNKELYPTGVWGHISYFNDCIFVTVYYECDGRHTVAICEDEHLIKQCRILRIRSVLSRINKYYGLS